MIDFLRELLSGALILIGEERDSMDDDDVGCVLVGAAGVFVVVLIVITFLIAGIRSDYREVHKQELKTQAEKGE